MNRLTIAAALVAASFNAAAALPCMPGEVQGTVPPGDPVCMPPPPSMTLGDSTGRDFVTLRADGVKLQGYATLSFSPFTVSGMDARIGSQAGWVTVRIGENYYAMPIFHIAK